MIQTLLHETKQALSFEYAAWVMYKSADINGKYVNVSEFIRKSIPEFSNTSSDSAITIHFFGGSTLFGVHAADNETIPSYFATLCKEKGIQKNIRVVNYGMPTYFSYQELMLFFQLLQEDKKPKLAVFFDGLNDFLSINEASQKRPMLNHYFKTIFNAATTVNHAEALESSFQHSFRLPSEDSITLMSKQLINSYLKTQEHTRTLAKAYHVQTCFFLQPVPFYDYTGIIKDPVCDKNNRPQFQLIYPELEKKSTTIPDFYFLGHLLKEEKGYPFADALHYSPSFSKKIAAAMVDQMLPMLQQL
ncbi:MAG: SGNH/GDSL hydrolase family protein [Chitinophagaceae bacterium]|nr:SGNH/GDSL hydrolase family protein [Chitinophagaceae bacterium]